MWSWPTAPSNGTISVPGPRWRATSNRMRKAIAPSADFIHVDGARNIIFDARTKDRRTPIAIVGLRDSILVQTDDAVLLAHKSQAQKVKELVKKLAETKEYRRLV